MKKLSFLILLLFATTCYSAETFKTKFNPFTSKLDYVHNTFGTVTGVVVVATDYMSGRYAPRVVSGIVVAAPAINTNTTDIFTLTGQPTNITSFTTNLTGSPKNGQKLIIKITDSGVARTIAWGASFKSVSPLPTTTVISKELWIGLFYDTSDNLWHCLTSAQE